MPRIRRLIDSSHPVTVIFLVTSSLHRVCDVLSDATSSSVTSFPVAILMTSQTDCRMEKSHLGYLLREKVIAIETRTQGLML